MSALTSHVVNSGLPVHSGKFRCSGLETEGPNVRGFSFHLQLFRSFNTHLYQTQYSSHILIISFDVPSSSAVIRPVIHTYGVRTVIRYDALESHSYLVILCTGVLLLPLLRLPKPLLFLLHIWAWVRQSYVLLEENAPSSSRRRSLVILKDISKGGVEEP